MGRATRRRRTRNRIGKSVHDLTHDNNKVVVKQVPDGRLASLAKQPMVEESSCDTEECSFETDNKTNTPPASPLVKNSWAGRAGYCYWDDLSTTSSEASYLERKRQRKARKEERKKCRGGPLATLPAAALVLKNRVRRGGRDRPDTDKASDGNTSRSVNPMKMMRKRLRRETTSVVRCDDPIV
mmetsp:Transcript_28412/g.67713  ORF Transcript_28412/g.67713 Transcript_28412/m.67713 type:complete len:183 (+) Transcript_28412:77-625(+)